MIEAMMYAGIGFLAASLLALGIVPLLHARTERLTMTRLEGSLPISMSELQADKDLLRAKFAMEVRRLELKIEQLTDKSAKQMAELGRRADLINRLQSENGARAVEIVARKNLQQLARARLAPVQRRHFFKRFFATSKTAA